MTTARWNARGTAQGHPIPERRGSRSSPSTTTATGDWPASTSASSPAPRARPRPVVSTAPRRGPTPASVGDSAGAPATPCSRSTSSCRSVCSATPPGSSPSPSGGPCPTTRRSSTPATTCSARSPSFFGIPLSFLALLTGIALGLGTPWGVLRYPWVVIKLILIVTVIVVGATILRPVLADDADAGSGPLIAGAAYDVAALTAATALAVFKPGRRLAVDRP